MGVPILWAILSFFVAPIALCIYMYFNFFKTLTLCALLLLMLSCQSDREVAATNQDLSDIPDQEGWNSTLVSTSKGKLSYKIKYVHMKRYSKKNWLSL